MPRLPSGPKLLAAALATLAATATIAAAQTPFVVAQHVLPDAVVKSLVAALSRSLGVSLLTAAKVSPPPRDGVFVLGSAAAGPPETLPVAPAGLIASAPMVLVAHTAFPAVESADIIALLKKEPGAKIAHDGPGTASERCAAHLRDMLPTRWAEVRKSPDVPPSQSVKAGEADFACLEAPLAIPLIQSGAVTPVLVAGDERLAAVWDVPTAAEVGLPLLSVTAWFGLYLGGNDAKPDAIAKANAALQTVLATEANTQSLTDAGLTPFPLTHRSAEAHAAFASAEAERGK